MKIFRSTSVYMLGEFIARALPFVLMPYLSRKLGAEGYGELALYQAWISLLIIIVSYAQDAAIIRYAYFYGRRSLDVLVGVGYFYSISVTVGLCLISLVLESEFMLIVSLCTATQTLVKIELTVRQANKKPNQYVVIQIVTSILSVLFTLIILENFHASAGGRMYALIISNAIVAIICVLGLRRKLFSYSVRQYKLAFVYLITFSTPLLANNLASFFKGQFDRVFIEDRFSLLELGEYAIGYQIASIVFIISFVIYRAVEPIYFSKLQSGLTLKFINQKVVTYGGLGLIPYGISLCIPSDIYEFLLGKDYPNVGIYVQPFILAFSINALYFVYSSYISYFGKTKILAMISVSSMILYLILLFVLSIFGLWALPYATVVSNVFLLFLAITTSKSIAHN
ncbi:oligosaccharide flippase family protein [Paraglaciecola aquimarina]|uniref:Oligosaccharide flippase family protein n=1 Tax=Paraglaciecola aquimarina TaxID=1235557 RepID=A0ABU3T1G1_9ALTE|nr:oligosaccharide flippase family protein [Paraglaciecola aquimarina]MDU0356110.1 oligosaccharide flippase family protein [Paraglaciecola aquimarina]